MDTKARRSQMRSAGWRQGGMAADKLIRIRYEVTPDEAKAEALRLIAEREPVLRQAGATDGELATSADVFAEAFAGKIERHTQRRAERERRRILWASGRPARE